MQIRTRIAAHRGGGRLLPENSLRAFENALALGVHFVEADIRLTADGMPVVLHDPTLDRTTTGSGPLSALALHELARLRLRMPDGPTDDPVPTLERLLDLVAPSAVGLLLEIKADRGGRGHAGIEAKLLELVNARGLLGRTIVMAFEPDTLACVRALEPGASTMLLVRHGGPLSPDAALSLATALGAAALGIDYRCLDETVFEMARKAGMGVAAWTVNEEAAMRRLMKLGVDPLITDYPDLALALLGRL